VPSPTSPHLTVVRLARLLERSCGPEMTLAQYRLLALLASGDDRASRLAKKLAVAKPTITAIIEGLVERGYVSRGLDPHDRRVVQLTITPSGEDALRRAEHRIAVPFADVLDRCTRPDAVLDALAQVSDALDARAAELNPVVAAPR
jgi:DNA-binding MarR family transcriptional regulator